MKKRKKDFYGRKYTTFGYYLHIVLIIIGTLSAIAILGATGNCDTGYFTCTEYVAKVSVYTALLGMSTYLHTILFNRKETYRESRNS